MITSAILLGLLALGVVAIVRGASQIGRGSMKASTKPSTMSDSWRKGQK
jgi:hypothetical protein